jgi:predicted HTH domain antitoxin
LESCSLKIQYDSFKKNCDFYHLWRNFNDKNNVLRLKDVIISLDNSIILKFQGGINLADVKIELLIPEDIMISINKNQREVTEDLKKTLAIELYVTSKLSLGKCSRLAGMIKEDFIKLLSDRGQSLFNWDTQDIETELKSIDILLEDNK